MQADLDRYEIYYADKLWKVMPEAYRAADSDVVDQKGPLRELCDRIGAQIAIVRRGIDRTWEDQSIESCDDWVVPYIADLLGTNLISGSDLPGQRREVANTIDYRRRKGTVALLEELAHDITGWEARVVELFRRLGRTRHGLDPGIGLLTDASAPLQFAAGLVGPITKTPIGGTASLRNAYGASKCGSAFDEFFHTPDVRRGEGRTGWYNIPKLGVFLWRLRSFPEAAGDPKSLLVTPVADTSSNAGCFAFDPTGREIPLFAAGDRATAGGFGAKWTSPSEWQLPTPIARALMDDDRRPGKAHPDLYAGSGSPSFDMRSLGVFHAPTTPNDTLDALLLPLVDDGTLPPQPVVVAIRPERGRFSVAPPPAGPLQVWYHYGFSAPIGAGAYDRRPLAAPLPAPGADLPVVNGDAVTTIAATGTITFSDSLTYLTVADAVVDDLTLRSANLTRPLVRPTTARGPWTFNGNPGSKLRLEGIFVSGVEIILAGHFDEVSIAFSTLDPGQSSAGNWAKAIDGRQLSPATLWIEGTVRALTIDRSITGPIRTRLSGSVEELLIRDSIVQFPAAPARTPPVVAATAPPLGRVRAVASGVPRDFAIFLDAGDVSIARSTILGSISVHHIDVSESILGDFAWAADPQYGCVRFSAWSTGSNLPRKYQSVRIAPGAELFTSRAFGQPGYAQLRSDADTAIASDPASTQPGSILEGAQNGSEMGAFYSGMAAIKERRLLLKLQEFMPLGLVPVIVHVT